MAATSTFDPQWLNLPTMRLLSADSRGWVIPLFAEHLEAVEDTVSAEWFHERVADALRAIPDWKGEREPTAHCRKWAEDRWLETELVDGRVRYRLSSHALRALQIVRETAEGQSGVSASRLDSIAHAVRQLAGMVDPDRRAQLERLDEQIAALTEQRRRVEDGTARGATVDEMRQQLNEILSMTRMLPADFRRLRALVEEHHQDAARDALSDGPSKVELVEKYLRDQDLLRRTPAGRSYQDFTRMLMSADARAIRDDVDDILRQGFARDHMDEQERDRLESMFSMLLSEQLQVEHSYNRWTRSLRRLLTRNVDGRQRRIVSRIGQALTAGAEWAAAAPARRMIDDDVLGVDTMIVNDSRLRLAQEAEQQAVVIAPAQVNASMLPDADRAALRLAAGTSPKTVARTVNRLIEERHIVTGAEVFEETPAEFQRLGALVSLLDLAVAHGTVDVDVREAVELAPDTERAIQVILPHLVFDRPIDLKHGAPV